MTDYEKQRRKNIADEEISIGVAIILIFILLLIICIKFRDVIPVLKLGAIFSVCGIGCGYLDLRKGLELLKEIKRNEVE